MLTKDGRVKVLDFGLAKLAEKVASDQAVTKLAPVTTEGTVMGTIPYMSPEQLRGQHVDHRSDVFSLGVLLYEMATGRRPFSGATNTDVMSSILRDTPRPADTDESRTAAPTGPHHHANAWRRTRRSGITRPETSAARCAACARKSSRVPARWADPAPSRPPSSSGASTVTSGGRKGLWIGIVAATVVAAAALFMFLGRNGGTS